MQLSVEPHFLIYVNIQHNHAYPAVEATITRYRLYPHYAECVVSTVRELRPDVEQKNSHCLPNAPLYNSAAHHNR